MRMPRFQYQAIDKQIYTLTFMARTLENDEIEAIKTFLLAIIHAEIYDHKLRL